jgi:carbamoyl-phosphate synthase large subunit
MVNILLTSVGRRSYLIKYFKEALEGHGLVHVSNSEQTISMQVADRSIITPLIYEENYIDFLINYCREYEITAIIPLLDLDLPVLAAAKERFKQAGVTLILPEHKITLVCNDKWLSYLFFKENGFRTPRTYIDINDALTDLYSNKIRFPVVIKPRWGMGSIGIYIADNLKELDVLLEKTKRQIFSTYLKFESEKCKENCVLIQEMIDGTEYGLDVLNDLNGRYVKTFVKQKLGMRSGETDAAITVNHPELSKLGELLGKTLCHVGNLDVDCFCDESEYYLLEMNCRFGGGYPFTHLAGVNIPKTIVYWLTNGLISEELLEMRYNVMGAKDILPYEVIPS